MANITLHFPDNFGGDTSKIQYIGFKGEATQVHLTANLRVLRLFILITKFNSLFIVQLKRDVVATIVYELMPNPSDHK